MSAAGESGLRIGEEEPRDRPGIRDVVGVAFRGAPHTCRREHLIVDAVRDAGALTLSRVAATDAGIVGHRAGSPVTVATGTAPRFRFGPLTVLPKH